MATYYISGSELVISTVGITTVYNYDDNGLNDYKSGLFLFKTEDGYEAQELLVIIVDKDTMLDMFGNVLKVVSDENNYEGLKTKGEPYSSIEMALAGVLLNVERNWVNKQVADVLYKAYALYQLKGEDVATAYIKQNMVCKSADLKSDRVLAFHTFDKSHPGYSLYNLTPQIYQVFMSKEQLAETNVKSLYMHGVHCIENIDRVIGGITLIGGTPIQFYEVTPLVFSEVLSDIYGDDIYERTQPEFINAKEGTKFKPFTDKVTPCEFLKYSEALKAKCDAIPTSELSVAMWQNNLEIEEEWPTPMDEVNAVYSVKSRQGSMETSLNTVVANDMVNLIEKMVDTDKYGYVVAQSPYIERDGYNDEVLQLPLSFHAQYIAMSVYFNNMQQISDFKKLVKSELNVDLNNYFRDK